MSKQVKDNFDLCIDDSDVFLFKNQITVDCKTKGNFCRAMMFTFLNAYKIEQDKKKT